MESRANREQYPLL